MQPPELSYLGYRFPPEVFSHAMCRRTQPPVQLAGTWTAANELARGGLWVLKPGLQLVTKHDESLRVSTAQRRTASLGKSGTPVSSRVMACRR